MPESRKMICVRCPRGCELTTTLDGGEIKSIEGNVCKLGEAYARDEIKDPRRVVTSTVRVKGGKGPLVPVWTEDAIPKGRIFDLMNEIRRVELSAPVKIGDVVIEDALGLGINVTASGNMEK